MPNEQPNQTSSGLSRRDLLRVSSMAAGTAGLGLTLPPNIEASQPTASRARACIVLFLVGGPSQLETWDPKPDAPADVRGPFGAIATNVPGVRIGEHLPRLAGLAHRYAIVRTVYHDAPPVHESGMQLLQTGHLQREGAEFPHFGSVLAQMRGPRRSGTAPFVVLPTPIGNTGINVSHGQGAGLLGIAHEPVLQASFTHLLPHSARERYGKTAFGDACARSVQLVEQGSRCVVVNMFDTVDDRVTWDCHADRHSLSSTLGDYRRVLCPTFDRAFATLLEGLHERGMLDETLVMALGEFGRTPRLNAQGGRDHWPGCWSIVLAGGGVRGGQVIGASNRLGAEPISRPIACAEVVATVYNAMGLAPATRLDGPGRNALPLVEAAPVRELFG
jgi:uncharacterized protein (DUF1501 family)